MQMVPVGDSDNCVVPESHIMMNGNGYEFASAIHYDGYSDPGYSFAGHYITYSKVNETWFRFNDSTVLQITEEEMMNSASKFYILCYRRI